MASPRAFSGLGKRLSEPFDWPLFFRTLPFQPVPIWLLLSALTGPFARVFPAMTRAACQGRLRESLSSIALVLYTLAVPFLVTTVFYLAIGRRRLAKRDHRLIADVTFGIMLCLTFVDASIMIGRIHEQWQVLLPGLTAIRAACWP
jgi:hypothetical protein